MQSFQIIIQGRLKAAVTYNEHEDLVKVTVDREEPFSADLREWFWAKVPKVQGDLPGFSKLPPVDVFPSALDTSFETFWRLYDYKVGKRSRAEKLWNALSEADRQLALKAIPKYNYWLAAQRGIAKLYPETYLSQRRFENEFKV